ncbi:MATE family efflux transporter [Vallitalea pronyensis]|uniref:MATE family efflux transporter n=1 Tax=Vallitalea pronyensis TaxID=1348613 RepID=UPI001BAF8EAD|nr:MATE family efflux transporter [Vallitalea pronyensis]
MKRGIQTLATTRDLTKGNIRTSLVRLALPLIATNFIQTAYNLVDMFWIGKLGSKAVIAIGTASFFINMAFALSALVITGASIRISQNFGSKQYDQVKHYITNGFFLAFIIAIIYSIGVILWRYPLISFFKLGDPVIENMAAKYLVIAMIGNVLLFANTLFANILNSLGNSKLSFRINSVGFMVNFALDPLLIFGVAGQLQLGIEGAAYATLIGRMVVFTLSIIKAKQLMGKRKENIKLDGSVMKDMTGLGLPYTIQRVTFIAIGIIMARIISNWGPAGIGVQKIGLQIESISFMTIGGLNGAVIAFMGQNYGANNMERIRKGYKVALRLSVIFGLITSTLFLLFPDAIFRIFVTDPLIVNMGVDYLRIIGLSQAFMCAEIMTKASFNGLGKTFRPAVVGLVFTALRIPLALYLASYIGLAVNGIWWSISMTSMIKGVLLVYLFFRYLHGQKCVVHAESRKLE